PNVLVLSASDWFAIQCQKTSHEQAYLFGSPLSPAAPAIWNKPVVLSPSLAVGTALLLDTTYVTVLDRMQATVTTSNAHSDFFVRNLVAILAELRAGLQVLDPWAVCSIS